MTSEADPDPYPDLRRPMPSVELEPAIPGYDLVAAVGPAQATPGTPRWRARRRADGVEVTVTCLQTAATPRGYAAAMEVAGMLSRVHHPHVVPLRDIVTWPAQEHERSGLAIITPGEEVETLSSVLQRCGALPPGQALSVLGPVAEGLQALHEHGVVHGALSATCVHLTRRGMPMVADAGLRACSGQDPPPGHDRDGYVAPEVLEGFPVTQQSDAYALAALVWHTLTGQAPGSVGAEADPADGPDTLPAWLTEMLSQGLGSDPDARPKVHEWIEALPDLGSPAPVDRLLDVGAELPDRVRAWARHVPRHDRPREPAHRARDGATSVLRPRSAIARPRVALTLLVLAAVLAVGAVLVRTWGAPAASSSPEEETTAPTAEPASAPGSGGSRSADGLRSTQAPRSSPSTAASSDSDARSVVQSVLDARGQAWQSGSDGDLGRALAVGSPAWQADQEDLGLARDEAVDFIRVGFRAEKAHVLTATSRATGRTPEMVVRTRVRREPVTLRDAQGERHRYPASTETVDLTLRRGDQGWRLYDWD